MGMRTAKTDPAIVQATINHWKHEIERTKRDLAAGTEFERNCRRYIKECNRYIRLLQKPL